jgi:CDP-glycerol glycerophosphotransferase (TagB/SpsB family)
MTRGQRRLRAILVRLGFALGRIVPLRRRVVLATAHADRLSGNLAWIRDELARRDPPVPTTVLARRSTSGLAGSVRAVVDTVVAGWHLATARVFLVDDYYVPMYAISPRPGTTRVQVWHACGAFKRFGYSVGPERGFGADEAALDAFPIHRNYSLALVSAARFAPFYAEAFRQPTSIFSAAYGIPRTDGFFDEARIARVSADLRARHRIPPGRRTILYAPTFRGADTLHARSPQDLDLAALRDAVGEDHVVLLRAHPFARAAARFAGPRGAAGARGGAGAGGTLVPSDLDGFVIDVSDEPEINDLMLVSDVLVTDYSSAIYEFALLHRPMAFFAPDHAAYERERGFYLDYEHDLPGPIVETTDALASWLRSGQPDLGRVRRFRDASFDVADGHATARLVDEVVLPALT